MDDGNGAHHAMEAGTTVTMQAYRFALDPTPAQGRDLERHAGAARFAYNWALAAVKANLSQRAAERSYDVADDEMTPLLGWNLRHGGRDAARKPSTRVLNMSRVG